MEYVGILCCGIAVRVGIPTCKVMCCSAGRLGQDRICTVNVVKHLVCCSTVRPCTLHSIKGKTDSVTCPLSIKLNGSIVILCRENTVGRLGELCIIEPTFKCIVACGRIYKSCILTEGMIHRCICTVCRCRKHQIIDNIISVRCIYIVRTFFVM